MAEKTYDNGQQDARIEAMQTQVATDVARIEMAIHRLDKKLENRDRMLYVSVNALRDKVNHIYGVAAALGAVAGILATALAIALKLLL